MNRLLYHRSAFRNLAIGIGPAVCIGSIIQTRRPIRCDSPSSALNDSLPRLQQQPQGTKLSPDKVRQISSGSVAGPFFLPNLSSRSSMTHHIWSRLCRWACRCSLLTHSRLIRRPDNNVPSCKRAQSIMLGSSTLTLPSLPRVTGGK